MINLFRVEIVKDKIDFHFSEYGFNAWLENANKHIPEIYDLQRTEYGSYSYNCNQLPRSFTSTSLRLSIGNSTDRFQYYVQESFNSPIYGENCDFYLKINNGALQITITKKNHSFWLKQIDYFISRCPFNGFERAGTKTTPLKIAVIGTCFSRSIFRSDDYFNPGYRSFFSVPLTFFHSSIISLMSNRLEDPDFLLTSDLKSDQVFRYTEVEFFKHIKERIFSSGIDYLVIDNYSDSALEVVEMSENCFITYNKYFADSIYKRKFSYKNIFTPGELSHVEKYRQAVSKLFFSLKELNLEKRVILVGGRLSIFKSGTELWYSKMNWIKNTNRNWDVYDSIFLEQFPDAKYIDMRNTSWISDVDPPITGGASPSHYQSGFYKEVFEKITHFILGKRT
ncbi:MAG: hypothetical protein IBX55_21590 [Methyloprofundus sp.]|nr:hypothetical protein [Methyloprofundus sp.]